MSSATLKQFEPGGMKFFTGNGFKSPDYEPYEPVPPSPAFEPLKAVKSVSKIAKQLPVNKCWYCDAICCRQKGRECANDCETLFIGETCNVCGHKGCLDFLENLEDEGMPSAKRGQDGLIQGLEKCDICHRQDCRDLIDPYCTRECGHEICAVCEGNGHESAEPEGEEKKCGNCGHSSCTSCEESRRLPTAVSEEEDEECNECGQVGECIPTKTREEWDEIFFDEPEVKGEREFEAGIRRL